MNVLMLTNLCCNKNVTGGYILHMCPPPLSCVVWMDGHLLLGGDSGDLHVWEADTLREINRHKAHSGLTNSLSLSHVYAIQYSILSSTFS